MFKLKFEHKYDAEIFTRYGIKSVDEDYYRLEDEVFCVADGITRDLIDGTIMPYPKTKEEVEQLVRMYPNPSGAYEASKIFANTFVEELTKQKEDVTEEKIRQIVIKANNAIWEINKNRKIDYVKEDLYCCVAVGGIIVKDTLYCFSLGDCHITALNENLDTVFTTINDHTAHEEYLNTIYSKEHAFDWNMPESRRMVRQEIRNCPDRKYNGKPISYGALTGEKEAEYYICTYKVNLKDVKYICAYSDGCEPNFENKEEIIKVINNPESIQEKGSEKTLVIYEKIEEER